MNPPGFPVPNASPSIGGYRGLQPGDPYTDRTPHRKSGIRQFVRAVPQAGLDVEWSGKSISVHVPSSLAQIQRVILILNHGEVEVLAYNDFASGGDREIDISLATINFWHVRVVIQRLSGGNFVNFVGTVEVTTTDIDTEESGDIQPGESGPGFSGEGGLGQDESTGSTFGGTATSNTGTIIEIGH